MSPSDHGSVDSAWSTLRGDHTTDGLHDDRKNGDGQVERHLMDVPHVRCPEPDQQGFIQPRFIHRHVIQPRVTSRVLQAAFYKPRFTSRLLAEECFVRSNGFATGAPDDQHGAPLRTQVWSNLNRENVSMDARGAIKLCLEMGNLVGMSYLNDLNDAELMQRPHPDCNHIKWQIGHLVAGENIVVNWMSPGSMPPLPEGFVERYTKETASSDDPAAFDSKADLLAAYKQQRAGTLAALEQVTNEQLDEPAPESMRAYAPTIGAGFSLQGSHWLMHAGQWAVVRRQLGRPPLF